MNNNITLALLKNNFNHSEYVECKASYLFKILSNLSLIISFSFAYLPGTNNILKKISIIAFLFFTILVIIRSKKFKLNLNIENSFLLIVGLYYLLGFFYLIIDTDLARLFWEQERKLSLLLIPTVLVFSNRTKHFNKLLNSLIIGSLFSIIYIILKHFSLLNFSDITSFISSFNACRYRVYNHHVPFNLMLNFSIVSILYILFNKIKSLNKYQIGFYIISITSLSFFLLNTHGRMGFITFLLICCISLSYYLIKKNKTIGLIAVITLSILTCYKMSTHPRLNKISFSSIETNKIPSELPRIYIWNTAFNLIKQNPIIGYGIGTTKDKLIEQYKKDHYTAGVQRQFHSHNQFLQSWLQFGLIGLIFSIIILFFPLYYFLIKNGNEIILFTWIIYFLANITEPMLQVSFGIFPFCIMVILMFNCEQKRTFINFNKNSTKLSI